MYNLNSSQLMLIHESLDMRIRHESRKPNSDYDKIIEFATCAKHIDIARRKKWHDEKFGVYENIVDEMLEKDYSIESDTNFTRDDIPF